MVVLGFSRVIKDRTILQLLLLRKVISPITIESWLSPIRLSRLYSNIWISKPGILLLMLLLCWLFKGRQSLICMIASWSTFIMQRFFISFRGNDWRPLPLRTLGRISTLFASEVHLLWSRKEVGMFYGTPRGLSLMRIGGVWHKFF